MLRRLQMLYWNVVDKPYSPRGGPTKSPYKGGGGGSCQSAGIDRCGYKFLIFIDTELYKEMLNTFLSFGATALNFI